MAHAEVGDAVVERVHRHVLGGMGLIVLHSGHFAKIFTKLLGTSCSLAWRNDGGRELVFTYDTRGERTGITQLLGDLGKAGIRFRDLQTSQSSLEVIFVGLVGQHH